MLAVLLVIEYVRCQFLLVLKCFFVEGDLVMADAAFNCLETGASVADAG